MNFVTNFQATEKIVPAVGSFDHPAAGGMLFLRFGPNAFEFAALRNVNLISTPLPGTTDVGVIISFISAQMLGLVFRRGAPDHSRIQGGLKMQLVVVVGARKSYAKRDAIGINVKVPFGTQFSPVGGVFPCEIPPFTGAETVALSKVCHFQSIPFRSSYSSKHTFHMLPKIPLSTHAWKWRWAVEPEQYSRGIIFHWQPVRKTYRMAFKIRRWGIGRRPPCGEPGSGGISRLTFSQNSSDTSRQPGRRRFGRSRRRDVEEVGIVKPPAPHRSRFNIVHSLTLL